MKHKIFVLLSAVAILGVSALSVHKYDQHKATVAAQAKQAAIVRAKDAAEAKVNKQARTAEFQTCMKNLVAWNEATPKQRGTTQPPDCVQYLE